MDYIEQPAGLGRPLGRYSHVSIAPAGDLISIAGQVGLTAGGEVAGDGSIGAQLRQAFANIVTALEAAGVGPSDVLKYTTFLVDAADIEEFMQARTEVFAELYPDGAYPPNTLLVVRRLVEERLDLEIEAIAVRAPTGS
jgi:enamine deaminase RidA (YjgF/YER057c/UK114 family)